MSFPLQLFSCRAALDLRSRDSSFINGVSIKTTTSKKKKQQLLTVLAMSSENSSMKMNLNEYMVSLQKPLGIRFGLSLDGKIFSNAEKSRIIMVGDTLKKASNSSGGRLIEIKNFGDAQEILTEKTGSFSLVLERPFSPFPIHELHTSSDLDILFNRGRVPVATWNKAALVSNLQTSTGGGGNSGFAIFSSKFLALQGLKFLNDQNGNVHSKLQKNILDSPISQLVSIFSEEEPGDGEWAHGSFPLEEYVKALNRSKGELYYNHSLGMHYSKVQDGDSYDIRKKLPFSVGLLLRLLKKNHRVFVTCTTGFDRSSTCVIAYLHWMTDTPLHAAHNFVTGLHRCKPDRPAIAWATWDLTSMIGGGRHDGPATHVVTFVWKGHEGEDVCLVGDFTGNWKEPIKATHKSGGRYEVEVRLPQGKYYYKYIINGNWRHSTSSPTERDERGNINNVLMLGDAASVRPIIQPQEKDANVIKVIERSLTENERFMLAKAARCIAFSVCPIRLAPK
ncbi:hypothetical protein COLO4_28986 [Corchorus olitorius]|uniref:AMP-activated protein kinase glycogen-binding domain-containing protein n=1 Tax=Corchorus olitorius TaxID=93759 RepID=A0A1R3HHA3_9ROSI|nr:hypothetical protein COLO4_28986 [Corchorus olitorius]